MSGLVLDVRGKPSVLGEEIAFENLVPGQQYFIKTDYKHPRLKPWYTRIVFEGRQGTDGLYRYTQIPEMNYPTNASGNPLPPTEEPVFVFIPGVNGPMMALHNPALSTFYKVSPVKEGRHLVGQSIQMKLNKNRQRKGLNEILDAMGLPTELGTGPANIIRKSLGLQPPKGTRNNWSSLRQQVPTTQTSASQGGKRRHRATRKRRQS